MRKVVFGSVVILMALACALPLVAQNTNAPSTLPVVDPNSAPAAAPAPANATTAGAPASPSPSSAVPSSAAPSSEAPASTTAAAPPQTGTTFNDVLDHVVQREHMFMAQMRHMHPMVETYLQDLKNDGTGQMIPVRDQYYLGRLDMSDGPEDISFVGQPGFGHRMLTKLTGVYSLHFLPMGFAQMVVLDTDFQKRFYDFNFVRREFLGEVRCLVIDVQPRPTEKVARFKGRIWVDDQDYNIVRFNGTYWPQPKINFFFHFDSWRLNLRPGLWLPAYVYTEESNLKTGLTKTLHFKAQTRLWGYDLKGLNKNEEFTQILIDSPQSVKDQSDAAADATPVLAERMWEQQAEENAVERIQKIGLLAPPGEVDKVLSTVVNNLLVTNNIDLQGDIHCRVLLTSPLESFTIGHTIVLSRGLLDVLPDEASLAMVLSHELSHIVLGHRLDTKLAFNDRMFFPDESSFQHLGFRHSQAEEESADTKAVELLKNSPYKDKLGNAGLFLKALQAKASDLPNLLRSHLGNSISDGKSVRMSALLATAPALDEKKLDQIAALPLGGRIKVDPWSDQVELSKAKAVALASPREKMEFEITPFFPYLTRLSSGTEKAVLTTSTPSAPEQK
ncbi:MAG TPA: M48 family metalloprotease [Candidatus Solibacter sp.]|nr:M48 family metalloprotease [Candidatus Solibacter sp.]